MNLSPIDKYTFNARVIPAVITIMPPTLLFAFMPWVSLASFSLKESAIASLALFGLLFFLSQHGRDKGRNKQNELFKQWGGAPTTLFLRHSSSPIENSTLKRYHSTLAASTNLNPPSIEDELKQPTQADETYAAFTRFLRENTRNKQEFPIVHEENINFGYRRNLWGRKPTALFLSLMSCALVMLPSVTSYNSIEFSLESNQIIFLVCNLLYCLYFITVVTPSWVKLAGDAYAEALISSTESFQQTAPSI